MSKFELMLITNQPAVARVAEAAGVDIIFLDLETLGKAERQAGFDTVKNHHQLEDIRPVAEALSTSTLLVRVNPVHAGTRREVEAAIDGGADWIMLPMFRSAREVEELLTIVDGRVKVNLLLETPAALARADRILSLRGVDAVHVGLNDLNLGLGTNFLFESLAGGLIDGVAHVARRHGVSFGFGGVARMGTGELPADLVIGEHARIGSERVILSRAFHGRSTTIEEFQRNVDLPREVKRLREVHGAALRRSPAEHEENRRALALAAARIAKDLPEGWT